MCGFRSLRSQSRAERLNAKRGGSLAGTVPGLFVGKFADVEPWRFRRAYRATEAALRERLSLTEEEVASGWREDWRGLRVNVVSGEIDDRLLVHRALPRPELLSSSY
jgi:hypothetical protein